MQVDEYIRYRESLLNDSQDEDGFISEHSLIEQIMPLLLDAKLVDSEDFNESPFRFEEEKIKINGYLVNESGERLQLFIVNEEAVKISAAKDSLMISQRAYYDAHFSRCQKFLSRSLKGYLTDKIQDSSAVLSLVHLLASSEGAHKFDVIEIFLISPTATVETRGEHPQPKKIIFEDDTIKVSFQRGKERISKEILIIKRLIDLNFLLSVVISQGNREELVIDFERDLKCAS